MTIEDVRKYAEDQKLPERVIRDIVEHAELDEAGNVVDPDLAVFMADWLSSVLNILEKRIGHKLEIK